MPAGNTASAVSLNLVAAPQPVKSAPDPKEVVNQAKPEENKQSMPKPEPNVIKKAIEKPIVKKETVKKKPAKRKPDPVKKANTTQQAEPVAEKETKPKNTNKKVTQKKVSEAQATPTKRSKGVSSQPVLLDKPTFVSQPIQPRYPRSARKRGIEGVAVYEIWLDEDGNQLKQVLIESSGADMLDSSALSAIKQWQFSPHISGGLKVAHRVQIPVRFKLDG